MVWENKTSVPAALGLRGYSFFAGVWRIDENSKTFLQKYAGSITKFCSVCYNESRLLVTKVQGLWVRRFLVCAGQEVVGAGVVEISQLDQNVGGNVTFAHFVVGIADL